MNEHELYPLWDPIESELANIDWYAVDEQNILADRKAARGRAAASSATAMYFLRLQQEQDGSYIDANEAIAEMAWAVRDAYSIGLTVIEIMEVFALSAHDPEHGQTPPVSARDVRDAVYDYAREVCLPSSGSS